MPPASPNIFDQFDTPIPTIAPDGKNPFDAFDGNVFDQFDEPTALKFANLPGNIKLNPLQQVQRQTRLAGQGERHHMPAVSVSTLSRDDGPALWMETADHAKTASHGNKGPDGIAYRARQAALIEQGRFDEALQMDIDDIRSKFGTKYDEGIRQMLDYYKTIPRWKLKLN